MKKRIVALILVAVMSILSLASCSAAFDFAKEDLTSYATFDYAAFKDALQKLVIEDDEKTKYTTDEKINEKREKEVLYSDIAEAIISAATDSDKKFEGKLGGSDVLNFVYYAEADGKVYFSSNMNVSTITSAASSHVLKLGEIDADDDADDEFLKLVKANLADEDVKDYIYSMVSSAEEAVKAGDTVYVSYKRSYQKSDDGGTKTDVSETANYERVTIADDGSAFSKLIGTKVGATYANGDEKTFEIVEDGDTVTYSDLKVLWLVEKEGKAISTFKYAPYTTAKSVTPDGLYSGSGVELKDVELTYYVFPVNYIHIPSADEITATDILKNVYGENLTADYFDVFGEDYVYTDGDKSEKIADLVAEVAKIFDTTTKDAAYYADGSELATLLKEYEAAKTEADKDGADEATKNAATEKKEALTAAQNVELDKIIAKIVAAKKGDTVADDAIVAEYKKNIKHNLKEEYDAAVTEKVQAAIWKLIDESVTVKGYPVALVEEYADHLYEQYEYTYHKGEETDSTSSTTTTNTNTTTKLPYESFDSVEAYIRSELSLSTTDDVMVALETEAKKYIEPIIKLYTVAKACESDAIKALTGENGYVRLDVKSGVYTINEEAYEETYGDRAADKIADAKESMEKTIAFNEANSGKFIIDDDFMKAYRNLNGKAYYDQMIKNYGDINVRAALQFERLFYYLASQNVSVAEDNDHGHTTEVDYVEIDGVKYLDFRTVKYTFAAEEDAAE